MTLLALKFALKILVIFLATAVLVIGSMVFLIRLHLTPKTTGIISTIGGLIMTLSGIGFGLQPFFNSKSSLENILLGGLFGVMGFLIFLFSIKATLEIRNK